MRKLSLVLGILCLLYVFLYTVLEVMPVDTWAFITEMLSDRNTHVYFKIVPAEHSNTLTPWFVFFVGALLVAWGKMGQHKRNKAKD